MPTSHNKTVLWIEDNADEKKLQFIKAYLEQKSLNLLQVNGVHDLGEALNTYRKDGYKFKAVIIDLMLHGSPKNLSPFNDEESGISGMEKHQWSNAADAGKNILEDVICHKNFCDLFESDKVLILTAKEQYYKSHFNCDEKQVTLIQKFSVTAKGIKSWDEKVKKWIKSL